MKWGSRKVDVFDYQSGEKSGNFDLSIGYNLVRVSCICKSIFVKMNAHLTCSNS